MDTSKLFEPIVKTLMDELKCDLSHDGLDLRLKRDHGNVGHQDRGPSSYEIIMEGRGYGNDVFPAKSIRYLLDTIIHKYFEAKGSVKEKSQDLHTKAVGTGKSFDIKNGKYLKGIDETETGYDFHTIDETVPDEVKIISGHLLHLLALAKSGIEDKTLQVNDKMKVGTLDSDKATKKLLLHTPQGAVAYEKDYVPKTLLLSSLWFILRLHQSTKHFLNHINFDVEYQGYVAKVVKGEVTLVTEGHSQLVIDLYTDLRRMESKNG